MEPRIIKSNLILKEITQTAIAKTLPVSVASVNDVISGKRRTPRIRAAIAKALGLEVAEIWPDAKPTQDDAA